MKKVYLFYYRHNNKLHSWTCNKDISKKFMEQRGKYFYMNKVKYDTEEELDNILGYFEGPNMELQVIPISSSNIDDDIDIVGTMDEEDQLFYVSDQIDDEMKSLYKNLSNIGLKKKYMKSIEYLCSIAYYKENDDGTKDLYSKMNLLSVFMNHFKI